MFPIVFPASYVLLLHLPYSSSVTIGKLGERSLEAGYYTYVGSARRNAQWRLLRHIKGDAAKKRWHIDYLRAVTDSIAVYVFHHDLMGECQLAAEVGATPGAEVPIARFGASDCRCPAHLFSHGERVPALSFSVEPVITLNEQEILRVAEKYLIPS